MPTGYTAYIEDGKITTGKDFLMLCARAMGACASMKEEPLSKPIPDNFIEENYYYKAMKKSQEELKQYQSMTIEEAQSMLDETYQKDQEGWQEYIDKAVAIKEAYDAVRADVIAWEPPTSGHQNLKKFALEQIDMCYRDCDSSYWEKEMAKPKQNAEDWLRRKIEYCEEEIKRSEKSWNEEKSRVEDRNNWIKKLRESFM